MVAIVHDYDAIGKAYKKMTGGEGPFYYHVNEDEVPVDKTGPDKMGSLRTHATSGGITDAYALSISLSISFTRNCIAAYDAGDKVRFSVLLAGSDALSIPFYWRHTHEGRAYWQQVHDNPSTHLAKIGVDIMRNMVKGR